MYYTVIKQSGHLRNLEKCRIHSSAARVFYISLMFSNACRVLSQGNTWLRLLYLLNEIRGFIEFLCRRSVVLRSRVFLVFLMRGSKKRRQKHPGKLTAKSRSQPVNLPGAWHLWTPCKMPKATLWRHHKMIDNNQGSRGGAVVRVLAFHQCVLGSRTRRHMWAEFVGSLLCSERFFSRHSNFNLS